MSTLRLVAFSDVHIGTYGSATDPLSGLNLGFLSNRRCRQALIDFSRENRPDYHVFAGDLYKSAIGRPTQTEQWEAASFFHELSLIAPVIAKPGNHDIDGTKIAVHALQVFDAMNMRMKVLDKEGPSVVDLDGVRVGVFHGMLGGVRLESGLMSDTVRDELPKLDSFPPADLWILGDIHHRQFVVPGRAAYCGAIDRLNFGEEDEKPGFWYVVVDKDAGTIEWKEIQTPGRKFVTLLDESDIEHADVKNAVVRFMGELRKYSEAEAVAELKRRGALEVQSVSNTSEWEDAPSLYSSFIPRDAFAIWLDAQTSMSKDEKKRYQVLLEELL